MIEDQILENNEEGVLLRKSNVFCLAIQFPNSLIQINMSRN